MEVYHLLQLGHHETFSRVCNQGSQLTASVFEAISGDGRMWGFFHLRGKGEWYVRESCKKRGFAVGDYYACGCSICPYLI